MMSTPLLSFRHGLWPVLLAGLWGCSPAENRTIPSAAPQVLSSAQAKVSASLPQAAPSNLAMNCDDFAVQRLGAYHTENNTWGKSSAMNWSQCVGIGPTPSGGGVSARWTWDWRYQGDQVKAYPEVVFGHKPGYPKSTTKALPARLSELREVRMDYAAQVNREGSGNMAVDMWLTNTPNPTQFAAPPITHEVMIWLEVYGQMWPGGDLLEEATVGSTRYKVHVGEQFGLGWRYVAFVPQGPMQPSAQLNLLTFFDYLKAKRLVSGQEYLAAVNLGNEVISGRGDTLLTRFAVNVR